MHSSPQLILASTSPYRKQLLERLGLQFTCQSPCCDEEQLKRELQSQGCTSGELAMALGRAKCQSISTKHDNSIVIGSDQLADFNGSILGKPGNEKNAVEQLLSMSGQTHQLYTAVSISYQGELFEHLDITTLRMANLDRSSIERYVRRDLPIDCAGAYKLEAAGISLFESIESADHSAITGLPLLFVCNILRQLSVAIP